MKKYQTVIYGEVDLDDPKTYQHLPDDLGSVLAELYEQIGYAVLYTNDVNFKDWGASGKRQKKAIYKLINDFAKDFAEGPYKKSLIFWQERLFIFNDEIENLC